MSSFALEEFVGNGVLRDQMDSFIADGWADVPTLKFMSKEDMDTLQLSQMQRDALEIRSHLHDRMLMRYADTLEASGKTLSELLSTSPTQLTIDYKMRRGHVARFLEMGGACAVKLPNNLTLPARKFTAVHRGNAGIRVDNDNGFDNVDEPLLPVAAGDQKPRFTNDVKSKFEVSPQPSMQKNELNSFSSNHEVLKSPVVLKGPFSGQAPSSNSRGIFSAPEVPPRLCGILRDKGVKEEMTPLSVLEKIMVQKVTPVYTKGANPFKNKGSLNPLPAPVKASELWAEKPTIILCLRRPGCVMCRAEAHQLYTRKPIFDAKGIQLVVLLNEYVDSEVKAFWPRYWGGVVVADSNRDFFKALGQGKMPRENYLTGFFLNPTALSNFKRATATNFDWNVRGEGNIKGGMYILRAGSGGIAYQFVERNFGDWAPLDEVMEACEIIMQKK